MGGQVSIGWEGGFPHEQQEGYAAISVPFSGFAVRQNFSKNVMSRKEGREGGREGGRKEGKEEDRKKEGKKKEGRKEGRERSESIKGKMLIHKNIKTSSKRKKSIKPSCKYLQNMTEN